MKKFKLSFLILSVLLLIGLYRCSSDDAVVTCTGATVLDAGSCRSLSWDSISAGGRHTYESHSDEAHTCGIAEGRLFCWGANGEGQLGTGDRITQNTPVQIGDKTDWDVISTGGGRSCGIRAGELYCWGSNRSFSKYNESSFGLLGLGSDYDKKESVDEPTRVGTLDTWATISVGTNHTCGILESGKLYCWGRDGDGTSQGGQLGAGAYGDKNKPTQEVTAVTTWAVVSAGLRGTTCAIKKNGTLWCWGQNIGGSTDTTTPTQFGVETDWDSISVASWTGCGIRKSGASKTLWCWGNNQHGQLGDGTNSSQATPVQIGSSTKWESVEAGIGYFCGINNSDLYCWGRNHDGELGLGKKLTSFSSCTTHSGDPVKPADCYSPELVNGTDKWTAISAGIGQSCAITGKELHCWGTNSTGEAGVSNTGSDGLTIYTPTLVE